MKTAIHHETIRANNPINRFPNVSNLRQASAPRTSWGFLRCLIFAVDQLLTSTVNTRLISFRSFAFSCSIFLANYNFSTLNKSLTRFVMTERVIWGNNHCDIRKRIRQDEDCFISVNLRNLHCTRFILSSSEDDRCEFHRKLLANFLVM